MGCDLLQKHYLKHCTRFASRRENGPQEMDARAAHQSARVVAEQPRNAEKDLKRRQCDDHENRLDSNVPRGCFYRSASLDTLR